MIMFFKDLGIDFLEMVKYTISLSTANMSWRKVLGSCDHDHDHDGDDHYVDEHIVYNLQPMVTLLGHWMIPWVPRKPGFKLEISWRRKLAEWPLNHCWCIYLWIWHYN